MWAMSFTADLEDQLDNVSAGDADYKEVLGQFWRDFSAAIAETSELRITEVLEKINEVLEPHLFPMTEEGGDPRLCPNCGAGRLQHAHGALRWGVHWAVQITPNAVTPALLAHPVQKIPAGFPPRAKCWARMQATISTLSRVALAPMFSAAR